ncbi:MAG: hypothetical protein AB1349_01580 [Elusimicrobiota bacterium]
MTWKYGDWNRLKNFLNRNKIQNTAIQEFSNAIRRGALLVLRNIRMGIVRQRSEWPPLSEITLRKKAPKTKKLIDTGEMIRSIIAIFPTKLTAEVGIPKGKQAGNGKTTQIHVYATTQEKGAIIRQNGRTVVIPKRPFIEPGFEESVPTLAEFNYQAAKNMMDKLIR